MFSRIVCSVVGHRRSKSSAQRVHGEWRSWCKRCGTRLVRVRRSRWRPLTPAEATSLVRTDIEKAGVVVGHRPSEVQAGHWDADSDRARVENPAFRFDRYDERLRTGVQREIARS